MAETINTDAPAYIVDGVLTDGEAWVALITNVLTSDASVVTFQSTTGANDWSQYMDLVIIGYDRGAYAAVSGDIYLQFNNDTSSVYGNQIMKSDGSSASGATSFSTEITIGDVPYASATANIFGGYVVDLFDINSGKHKTTTSFSGSNRDGAGEVRSTTSAWESQAAITEIDIIPQAGDHLSGSRFDLFGVLPRMVS
jgi:hypothetical protein